jgi:hypothetical protein
MGSGFDQALTLLTLQECTGDRAIHSLSCTRYARRILASDSPLGTQLTKNTRAREVSASLQVQINTDGPKGTPTPAFLQPWIFLQASMSYVFQYDLFIDLISILNRHRWAFTEWSTGVCLRGSVNVSLSLSFSLSLSLPLPPALFRAHGRQPGRRRRTGNGALG